MTDVTWDDLRVLRCGDPGPHDAGYCLEGMTPAERDMLGRAWLRDKLGDVDLLKLRNLVYHLAVRGVRTDAQQRSDVTDAGVILESLLAALNGAPEDTGP